MLEDLLEKFTIVNSVGEEIGKIKEIYIDLDSWEITAFKVSPGVLKGSFLLDLKKVEKVDLDANRMVVSEDIEKEEIPDQPKRSLYPYDELQKHEVIDSEEEKVGKIYSLEIPYQKLGTFKVWKLLIKTGIKDRRLRISPTEVHEVMDKIKLRKDLDFYQGKEEKEE